MRSLIYDLVLDIKNVYEFAILVACFTLCQLIDCSSIENDRMASTIVRF